jgi:toxin-antitoxin system PIN domain toxin
MPSTNDVWLLDANVLIALTIRDHEHHDRATAWLGDERRFATCPITQGALVRYVVRVATTEHALDVLEILRSHPRHEFWPDDAPFNDRVLVGVIGHRQVTDAYLAHLAAGREQRLATFDGGLAQLRPGHVDVVG